jgi:hypothetical protein
MSKIVGITKQPVYALFVSNCPKHFFTLQAAHMRTFSITTSPNKISYGRNWKSFGPPQAIVNSIKQGILSIETRVSTPQPSLSR